MLRIQYSKTPLCASAISLKKLWLNAGLPLLKQAGNARSNFKSRGMERGDAGTSRGLAHVRVCVTDALF